MCNCISDINEQLREMGKNTQLDIPITWGITKEKKSTTLKADRVRIATRKLDEKKREKPVSILPSYCPFCGEAYPQERQEES